MLKNPRWPAGAFGEGGRFESLYKKCSPILFKFIAKRMGRHGGEVEEVFEDTMVSAWKGLHTFQHKSTYFTWLCRIALNKISDYYRDQVNKDSRLIVPFIDSLIRTDLVNLSLEEKMALKDLKSNVNACLNLLPPKKRQLLQLRYWEELSYQKISELTGLSIRAVEGQLYRAKAEFAKAWDENNPISQ